MGSCVCLAILSLSLLGCQVADKTIQSVPVLRSGRTTYGAQEEQKVVVQTGTTFPLHSSHGLGTATRGTWIFHILFPHHLRLDRCILRPKTPNDIGMTHSPCGQTRDRCKGPRGLWQDWHSSCRQRRTFSSSGRSFPEPLPCGNKTKKEGFC